MNLEVIGAGFGRTGTRSLKAALEELGFGPCYHMEEVFVHPEHVELWEAAVRGEPADWEQVFQDYRTTVDWPGAAFYEELLERNPEAKVILTVRHPDRWYESARNTIYNVRGVASSPLFSSLALFIPPLRRIRRAALMAARLIWDDVFDGGFEDRRYATSVFDRWNEEVVKRVPAEKLLVFEVKEGWRPLCEFLGVEPPEASFPHLNDAASFRKAIRLRQTLTVILAGGLSVGGLVLLYLGLIRLREGDLRSTIL